MQNASQAKRYLKSRPRLYFCIPERAEIESVKMSELNAKLYFRVAFLALLLLFTSGERTIIRNLFTS